MKYLFLVIAVVFLWSCRKTEEEYFGTFFYFDSPQPVNDSELRSLPSKFRGKYFKDNKELTITDKAIYYTDIDEGKLAKSSIDSFPEMVAYKNNKLIFFNDDKEQIVFNAKEEKDSIYYYRTKLDTVFHLSERQKAKRINGQLVLSTKDSVFWTVDMLALKKDSLEWKFFSYKEDYVILKNIVKDISINADTTITFEACT